jgi:hypothetical protein
MVSVRFLEPSIVGALRPRERGSDIDLGFWASL